MRADPDPAAADLTALEPLFDGGGFYPPEQAAKLLSYPEDQALLREALRVGAPG